MGAQALSTIGEGLDPVALDDIANREAVLDELQRVLNHSTFKDTKRLKRFLEYVVMETLDGRGARLKGYSLGIEVFDRADDFDPQGDTIVRVQAGQLRRRLDLYYDRYFSAVNRRYVRRSRLQLFRRGFNKRTRKRFSAVQISACHYGHANGYASRRIIGL